MKSECVMIYRIPMRLKVIVIIVFVIVAFGAAKYYYDLNTTYVAPATTAVIPTEPPAPIVDNSTLVPAVTTPPPVISAHDKPFLDTLIPEPTPDLANFTVHQLPVPAYKQQEPRSCEEASLRMVLAYYNIQATDMEVVQKVGYNPHPWDTVHDIWDDPNTMFVGNIDDPAKSGYGAFAPALAKAARAFGRSAQSYTLVSGDFIATQVEQDHPVMVWGFFNTPPYVKYSWQTPAGKNITAYRGEHVRVVTGTLRTTDGLLMGFFLNDPLTGAQNEYWSVNRLTAHMNMWGALTNQVVVVQ
ncbi:MAG: hypothetical protein JWM92_536 [Candidatus Nomurabacteria bacterium]|nr:hypothetical protein [Candidatus Nomurabacteria bacterium]